MKVTLKQIKELETVITTKLKGRDPNSSHLEQTVKDLLEKYEEMIVYYNRVAHPDRPPYDSKFLYSPSAKT